MTELVGTQRTDEAKPEADRIVIETDDEARRKSGAAKTTKKRRRRRIVEIGALPVDAGVMMLGDPCYVVHPKNHDPEIYDRICQLIDDKPYVFFSGSYGPIPDVLVAKTGYGDGIYPVFAELDENDRVMSITISFQPW